MNMPTLSDFKELTVDDVTKLVRRAPSKSCELDPIPTSLLEGFIQTLAPVITRLVNMSLQQGVIPSAYKAAILRPLLKKPTLERIPKNYRPVSNLSFLSKIIEQAVSSQTTLHLTTNDLAEKHQSAYRKLHSTETALTKVFNDILLHLDNRKIVLLNLLDISAAFDTLDHVIMLRRLSTTFGITGTVRDWYASDLNQRSV